MNLFILETLIIIELYEFVHGIKLFVAIFIWRYSQLIYYIEENMHFIDFLNEILEIL